MANITRRNQGQEAESGVAWDPYRIVRDALRWDPFREVEAVLRSPDYRSFAPAFDVAETKDGYVFRADLPGVKEEDLEISLTGTRLAISGRREREAHDQNDTFYASERSYGGFTRTFTLPEGVDGENVHAELKNGVLVLTVPKKPEVQPKKIQLGSKGPAGASEKAKA
jgi:HSP20 family protein